MVRETELLSFSKGAIFTACTSIIHTLSMSASTAAYVLSTARKALWFRLIIKFNGSRGNVLIVIPV
jgi:hypothetical protein